MHDHALVNGNTIGNAAGNALLPYLPVVGVILENVRYVLVYQ